MAEPALVIFPEKHAPEAAGHNIVDANWIVQDRTFGVGQSGSYVGSNLLLCPGVDEAFGPDYRYVMATRQPLTVRRIWNNHVWHAEITAHAAGGIEINYRSLYKFPDVLLTQRHLVEFANRVSESLSSDVLPDANAGTPASTRQTPAPVPLRGVPAPK